MTEEDFKNLAIGDSVELLNLNLERVGDNRKVVHITPSGIWISVPFTNNGKSFLSNARRIERYMPPSESGMVELHSIYCDCERCKEIRLRRKEDTDVK